MAEEAPKLDVRTEVLALLLEFANQGKGRTMPCPPSWEPGYPTTWRGIPDVRSKIWIASTTHQQLLAWMEAPDDDFYALVEFLLTPKAERTQP